MTPFLPTVFMAEEMREPISRSPLAEIVATWEGEGEGEEEREVEERGRGREEREGEEERGVHFYFSSLPTPFPPELSPQVW